jgi:hypothetical protein
MNRFRVSSVTHTKASVPLQKSDCIRLPEGLLTHTHKDIEFVTNLKLRRCPCGLYREDPKEGNTMRMGSLHYLREKSLDTFNRIRTATPVK